MITYIMSLATNGDFFTPQLLQTIASGIFGAGFIGGLFALLTKRSRSPESQNELARLGNDFASKMLEDARVERRELRDTIRELEASNATKQETIDRLNALAQQKDVRIEDLEKRQQTVARKLQAGEKITLQDIFGEDAPTGIHVSVGDNAAVA